MAVLVNYELGQSAGQALAEVLWGDVAPSGALPFTIFRENYVDLVAMPDYSMEGHTYRYYRPSGSPAVSAATAVSAVSAASAVSDGEIGDGDGATSFPEPLWWFGYSLSYTTFAFAWAGADASGSVTVPLSALSQHGAGTGLKLSLSVTNTGAVAGSKVIQAYFTIVSLDNDSGTFSARVDTHGDGAAAVLLPPSKRPRKSLFAMTKVHLEPGARADVTLYSNELAGSCAFCSYQESDADAPFAPRAGKYSVSIGDGGHTEVLSLDVALH